MKLKKLENKLSPLLKYPGGKDKELIHILPNLPADAANYYEPFVGGGAVFFAVKSTHYYINDKSDELMNLYELIAEENVAFLNFLEQIEENWILMSEVIDRHSSELLRIYKRFKSDEISKIQLSDEIYYFVFHNSIEFNGMLTPNFNVGIENFVEELFKCIINKIVRMKMLENKKGEITDFDKILNIESSFKSAFYIHFRYLYNNINNFHISKEFATAIYFYIREYCYSSMFRYNSNGGFNVPYGGISYNRKSLEKKINYFKSEELKEHLKKTTFDRLDFFDFMSKYPPKINDFVFLDPPYDTEFSTYAQNTFAKSDQQRLAKYLIEDCNGYFMLIIKDTEFIQSLYKNGIKTKNGRILNVEKFDKKYMVSFQNRNEKNVEHLLITNYQLN